MARNNLPKVLRKQAVRFGLIIVLLATLVGVYILEMQHSTAPQELPTKNGSSSGH